MNSRGLSDQSLPSDRDSRVDGDYYHTEPGATSDYQHRLHQTQYEQPHGYGETAYSTDIHNDQFVEPGYANHSFGNDRFRNDSVMGDDSSHQDVWPDDESTQWAHDESHLSHHADNEHHEMEGYLPHDSGYQHYNSHDHSNVDYVSDSDYQDGASIPDFLIAPGSQSFAANGQLNDNDFIDTQTTENRHQARKALLWSGGIVFLFGFAILTFMSARPEMSRLDIVQMDGYGGQQTARNIYYVAQLNDCMVPKNCKTEIVPITTETTTAESTKSKVPETIPAENFASSKRGNIREIPAFSTPDESALSSDAPLQFVLYQWSNVRSAPTVNSSIITSLAKGTSVKPLQIDGDWVEIEIPGTTTGTTGFMHQSTVSE